MNGTAGRKFAFFSGFAPAQPKKKANPHLGLLAFTRLSISFRIFRIKILRLEIGHSGGVTSAYVWGVPVGQPRPIPLFINLIHMAVRSSVSQTRYHSRSKSAPAGEGSGRLKSAINLK